jgi:hypothetical protein
MQSSIGSLSWTAEEETIIANIMATEKMLKDEFSESATVPCNRAEAVRRARRRKLIGAFPEPQYRTLAKQEAVIVETLVETSVCVPEGDVPEGNEEKKSERRYTTRFPDGTTHSFETEGEFDAYVELFKTDPEAARASVGYKVAPVDPITPIVQIDPVAIIQSDEELPEEGFRNAIPEKSPNGINSLQTQESDENSKTDILDPAPIETPECVPEPFMLKSPGRPKKARVMSSAERMAALRARRAEQQSFRKAEARETLGLTETSVLSTFPLIKRTKAIRPQVSRVLLENKMLEQSNRCIYCERNFGSRVLKGGELVALKAQAEHFIPVAVRRNDHESNINASCHICNGLKSSRRFESLYQAREILKQAWTEQGYRECPMLIPFRRAASFGIAPEQCN